MLSSSNLRWPLPLGAALVLAAITLAVGTEHTTDGAAVQAASSSPAKGAGTGNSGNGVGNGPGAAAPAKSLVLHTEVLGAVRLGTPAQLRVRVQNPNSQDVHLRAVTAAVTAVTSARGAGPGCAVDDFSISSFAAAPGTRRVVKGGSTTVDLVITLRDTAADQDRCKGAQYAFDARATAEQA